jgi:NADPH-dependent 7-cyano-7-deazaguanine reductase QueF-like protein
MNSFYAEKDVYPNSFSFSLLCESKVFKYLNSLSASKATGLDGIPSRFVRDESPIIADPITHIVNLSLIQGVVPDDLKTARVVPLFK